jgi:hypothetical protein
MSRAGSEMRRQQKSSWKALSPGYYRTNNPFRGEYFVILASERSFEYQVTIGASVTHSLHLTSACLSISVSRAIDQ